MSYGANRLPCKGLFFEKTCTPPPPSLPPWLIDGKGVGIAWTSSNLNAPWFGGSQWIPNSDPCNGNAWRALIIDGLNQASVGLC